MKSTYQRRREGIAKEAMAELGKAKSLVIPGAGLQELPPVRQAWRAASSTRAGMFHYTFLYEDGKVDCTCEGWRMNKKCWHTTQVMEEHELDPEFSVSLEEEGS